MDTIVLCRAWGLGLSRLITEKKMETTMSSTAQG